jgi:hypothetical protein
MHAPSDVNARSRSPRVDLGLANLFLAYALSEQTCNMPQVDRMDHGRHIYEARYALRYAVFRGYMCLQGLREPPWSCKLLRCLMLAQWYGRDPPTSCSFGMILQDQEKLS